MQVIVLVCVLVSLAFGQTYRNPIINGNDPDPGVIYVDGVYYASTTTTNDTQFEKFPIHSSKNLVDWTLEGYIFDQSNFPSWAKGVDTWAPEIHYIGGQYVVYYVARDMAGVLCIGAASAPSVTGKFTDIGAPLEKNDTMGMIDPTYYVDNGIGYLIWKEDGNGANPPEKYTPIWLRALNANGLSFASTPKVEILRNDPSSWEGPLVEAPWIIFENNFYYLFYSANGYAGPAYAVGIARSKTISGPYQKWDQNPIVQTNSVWAGPGHCSVVRIAGTIDYVMIYHSWVNGKEGGDNPRMMLMDQILWTDDQWPFIAGFSPSNTTLPVPSF
jgi:beta-xylosidase